MAFRSQWRSGPTPTLEIGNAIKGRIKMDDSSNAEDLTGLSFTNDQLQFTRPGPNQQYTGIIRGDDLHGKFKESGNSYSWAGRHVPSPLMELTTDNPRVCPIEYRSAPPGAQRVLVMRYNGLAVLAHNVTNPPADYTPVYQAWQQGKPLGDGLLQLMLNENVVGGPHFYRNIVFGDPTLKLSY